MNGYSDRNWAIMHDRFIRGKTTPEIGHKYGISSHRVVQILYTVARNLGYKITPDLKAPTCAPAIKRYLQSSKGRTDWEERAKKDQRRNGPFNLTMRGHNCLLHFAHIFDIKDDDYSDGIVSLFEKDEAAFRLELTFLDNCGTLTRKEILSAVEGRLKKRTQK